ncbi:DUF2218 domain-containing protein [Ancylobacter lacus]|uniref:DUF2218 domain-containing protein n=1 Tax=Ancylobacter lacus TaxID=2579970 RepID=UPI001BCC75FA|nr:DUF2218 domain-containing protein [Ancylobacter lacus]MBS7541249.1 DUF2218 domain-containing protein [Ancylobacter lacus]
MTETVPTNRPAIVAAVCNVPTAHASRYLQQLCKHWSHRFAVSFTPEEGTVELPESVRLELRVGAGTLGLRLEAASETALEPMKGVVERHLDRLAFREAPLAFRWTPAA